MTFYIEKETDTEFSFQEKDLIELVAEEILTMERCPYEAEINIILTDKETIREYNSQHRQIYKSTDVLSFPNVNFQEPSDFSGLEEFFADYFDPDTGELILGDIILCVDHVKEQAVEYGHSEKREFAFLIAHSMLHLCGYDHETEQEAAKMEEKQSQALINLGITRDAR